MGEHAQLVGGDGRPSDHRPRRTDHYGRTLALVAGDKGDLSCWQLAHDQAIYKARWDDGLRVARACPGVVSGWR